MNKTEKLPKGFKRGLAGIMAVVLTATALVPTFTAMTSASFVSLNYIEEIKDQKIADNDSFKILEIAPSASETSMGYYVDDGQPISYIAENTQAAVVADNTITADACHARREDYMNNTIYASLQSKGVIGNSESYPLTSTGGYKEYYPWQTETLDNAYVVAKGSTESLKHLQLDDPDVVPVKGSVVRQDGGNYDLDAIYTLSGGEIFDIKAWANNAYSSKSNSASMTVTNGLADRYIRCYGTSYYTNGNCVYDFYTGYGESANYYNMPLVPGATYTITYNVSETVASNQGGQFFLFMLDENYKYCYLTEKNGFRRQFNNNQTWGAKVTDEVREEGAGSFFLVHDQGTIDDDGTYTYTFTVPKVTNTKSDGTGSASTPKYCQVRFGTCRKDRSGACKFSNISIKRYGGGNFVQDINHFEYVADNSLDNKGEFFYNIVATPLTTMAQWDAIEEGVAIYTKEIDSNGNVFYEYLGTTENGVAIDIDVSRATNASDPYYFLLDYNRQPKVTINGKEAGVPVVLSARDEVHTYIAVANRDMITDANGEQVDNGPLYSDDVPAGEGYFDSDSIVLTYNPGEGRWTFVEDENGAIETTITVDEVYYTEGFINNEFFKYQVMDWVETTHPGFQVDLYKRTPETMVDDTAFLDSIRYQDLIIITAGTNLQDSTSSFIADIPVTVKNAIIEAAGSEYKVPVIVDIDIISPSNKYRITENDYPNLYSLITTLANDATSQNVSITNGGVAGNIYAYKKSDITGAKCFANDKFNVYNISGSNAVTSPYYDVYAEIYDENVFRSTYKAGTTLPLQVTEATCIRSIINYKSHRVRNLKNEIRVLDIEPYTSRAYLGSDGNISFTSKELDTGRIETLSALKVLSWLPSQYCTRSDDGKTFYFGTGASTKTIKTEREAAEIIKITTMSVAELNTCNNKIVEDYDMVYIGASVDNLNDPEKTSKENRAYKENGAWYFNYNDKNIGRVDANGKTVSALLYTSIGDTFVAGNVNYGDGIGQQITGTFEGNTLAGLLREDYAGLIQIKSGGSNLLQVWNLPASYVFEARPAGNDITKDKQLQLEEFAAAGLPVVYASELCVVPQAEEYSIDVSFDSYFRRVDQKDSSKRDWFVYFSAELKGDLPAMVSVRWEWYYHDDRDGKDYIIPSKFEERDNEVVLKKGDYNHPQLGKISNGDCEPIAFYKDEETGKRYCTLGFIKPDGTIGYDLDGYTHYEGMTVPDYNAGNRKWQNHDPGTGYYYCKAIFSVPADATNSKKQMYDGKSIISSNYKMEEKRGNTSTGEQCFKIDYEMQGDSSSSNNKANRYVNLTITPNPYYAEHIAAKRSGATVGDKKFYSSSNFNKDKIGTSDSWNGFEDYHFEIHSAYDGDVKDLYGRPEDAPYGKCGTQYMDDTKYDHVTVQSTPEKLVWNTNCYQKSSKQSNYPHKGKSGLLWWYDYNAVVFWVQHECVAFMTYKAQGDFKPGAFNLWKYYTQDNTNIVRGTVYMPYSILNVYCSEQKPATRFEVDLNEADFRVDRDVIDDTSNLYQFMSQAYDNVTTNAKAREEAAKQGFLLQDRVGLSNVMSVFEISQDNGVRLGAALSLSPPRIIVDERSLESYNETNPKSLSNNTLTVNFRVNCDMDSHIRNNETTYYVYLYIDANHDAVYSASERVPITTLREKKLGIADKENGVYKIRSSTSDESSLFEYTLEKQIPSTYQGVLPWKLEIVDTANRYFHDSYIGYAYMAQTDATVIKCLQVLSSDQYSNNKNSNEFFGTGNEISDQDYTIRGAWKKTGYTMEQGNAYIGSVFMGIDSKYNYYFVGPTGDKVANTSTTDFGGDTNIYKNQNAKAPNGKTDMENDAFYQLTLPENGGKIKRTIYYEPLAGTEYYEDDNSRSTKTSALHYRTHVIFWINPSGQKTVEKNPETGATMKDYFNRDVEIYQNCDFKVDIALTDIYELNFYVFRNEKSYYDLNKNYLKQYDMLVLGFGDNYGKYRMADNIAGVTSTLGFNQYTAWAVSDYINEGRPVLFCHDTLNHQTNFINYFGNTLATKFTELMNTVSDLWVKTIVPAAKAAWTSVKNWWFRITGQDDKIAEIKDEYAEVDENDLDSNVADSRVKNGYYNNLLMRNALKQDRYGITYAINKAMDDTKTYKLSNDNLVVDYNNPGGKTHWQANNYKAGHYFTWMLGTTNEEGKKIYSMEAVATYASGVDRNCYVTTLEMLGEDFSIANQPNSAKLIYTKLGADGKPTADSDTVVAYKYYSDDSSKVNGSTIHSGNYTYVTSTDRRGNRTTEQRSYNNYTLYNIQDPVTGNINNVVFGGQVSAFATKQTQGFTTWTMLRWQTNQKAFLVDDKGNNINRVPIGTRMTTELANHEPQITTAIRQVNKGSLTTYPYDINTAEFGGTTGDAATGKIPINPTHEQTYQVHLNAGETTVWYTLADPIGTSKADRVYDLIPKDGVNDYYIYSSGNLTYTGAGHTNAFNLLEAKLFINTLIAAYRVTEEIPTVFFMDGPDSQGGVADGTKITYKLIAGEASKTADEANNTNVETSAYSSLDGDVIVGVMAVDPNIAGENSDGGQLTVQFASALSGDGLDPSAVINVGTIYTDCTNGRLGGTAINNNGAGYPVKSDQVYYFKIPQSELDKLQSQTSTVMYAQASLPDADSIVVKLELRRLGLDVMS